MPKGGSTINWSNFSSNMCVPNHVSSLNWLSQGPMNGTSAQQVVKQTNFGMNLRA